MTTENDLIRRSAVGKAGLRAGRRRSRALARVVPTVAPLALLASFPATAAAASPAPAKESAAAPAPAQEPAARPPRAISSKPAGTPTPLYDASGQSLTAHLLTVGPGDAVEEIFGHNALLVRDTVTGYEAAFNYGLFDPNAAGFVFNFFMGNMMYRVAPLPLDATLASARFKNRTVWAQELDLEPAAKAALLDNLLTAALPSNMHYRYQYFLDNCSTRIRDAIDGVLDGQIRAATEGVAPSRVTWRDHTRRLAGEQLHLYAGIDLLLGPSGDAATDLWQEMWVPMKLRDTLASFYVTGADGVRRRLVRSEEVWVQSDRGPEPIAPRSSRALFLGIGAALAAMLIAADARARRGSRVAKMGLASLGVLWGGFCLVAGMVLLAMHATDHEFMHWNRNILVFSPLGAGVAAALVGVARRGAVAVWARRACIGALGLAVLALILHLLPWGRQENLMMIALAMPVHLAVCLVVGRTFGEAKGSQGANEGPAVASRFALTAAVVALTSSSAVGQDAGPQLSLLETVLLQEDDEHYVSAPVGLAIGPDDSFLISDAFAASVLQFGRDGSFVRAYGRRGQGPGEFMAVASAVVVGTLLVAVDMGSMELEIFDLGSGTHRGAVGLQPTTRITSLAAARDSVWITGHGTRDVDVRGHDQC